MARPLTLEPHNVGKGNKPWQLYIPPNLSTTGKRQRLHYASKEQAQQAAQTFREQADGQAGKIPMLCGEPAADAIRASALLSEFDGLSLTQAANILVSIKRLMGTL